MNLIKIQNYIIKIDDLLEYSFSCSDDDAKECFVKGSCCCNQFHIETNEANIDVIYSIMDKIVKYCPNLIEDGEYLDVFLDEEEGIFSIDKDENEHCSFSYLSKDAGLRCAIHSVALDMGEDPAKYKPVSCTSWPIMRYDDHNGKIILALDRESNSSCIKKKDKPDARLDKNFSSILESLLGKELWTDLVNSNKFLL